MIELSESKIYEFEEFRLDAKSHRLFRRESDELVPLTPKAVELLLFFIQNRGQILTKNELLDTVWGNSFVEESNLSQTIFVLRKTLGENTKEPRFILTAPNRGYQFIAPVKEIHSEDEILEESFLSDTSPKIPDSKFQIPDSNPQSEIRNPKLKWLAVPLVLLIAFGVYWFYPKSKPAATVSEIKTIAILPFTNIGVKTDEEYLGQGLSEVLISKLSNIKTIVVRPNRAVLKYSDASPDPKKIGSELDVEAIIIGRVQKIDENIRVTVQLVRVSDGATLWAETFDDKFTNIFAVQDSISQKVVQSLAVRLDPTERQRFERRGTENAQAYQEYLLGRFFWNKRSSDDLNRAITHFKRAVEIDANFANAYAGLAETYAIYPAYAVVRDKEALPKARVAANRALEIDGELAEAYTVLAYVQSQYDFDWNGAEKSYLRAIELNPNHPTTRQWYGEFLAFQNRTDESLAQMQKAIELDPTSPSTNNALALPYLISRQFEKTLEVTDKVLEMDANFLMAQSYRVRALFRMGRETEAFELYRKILAANDSAFLKADLGCLYGKTGNEAEARKILAELYETAKEKSVSPYHFAVVYLGLNEREKAFDYLRKAVAEHDNNIILLKVSTNFDSVRADPQFIEILRSANF